jgi:beta-phosphoglucomutase-like phosphatase (HAD superfamily)
VTNEPSSPAALDAVIRQAQYLVFAFDGPIRSMAVGTTGNPAANPPTPHIHDTLAACRESGRSAAVISATPSADVWTYLNTHDLAGQITIVTSLIGEAVTALDASPAECAVITSFPSDIQAARAAGVPSIGYAKMPDNADRLKVSGAGALVTSMANLALRLRAGFTA